MSKKLLLSVIITSLSLVALAQDKQAPANVHKIVFQLSSDDTLVHKGLIRQLNNVLAAAPSAVLEIVCYGPGINILLTGKTIVQDKIRLLSDRGVQFVACENTLKEKNIAKAAIIPEAGFVPAAIIEIVKRQEQGWSYIKAGF